jgi:hypothetical protein
MEGVGMPMVERIKSNAEGHFRPSGGWKAGGTAIAQSVSSEHKTDERRRRQFHNFYQMVIEEIGAADKVFIFGPGEAKSELAKEIESVKGPHVRIAAVEASDKLTENQVVAKVKSFFESKESTRPSFPSAAGQESSG